MEEIVNTLRELIQQGKKIQAVKEAREQLNIGLKEAKDLVEALEQGKPIDTDTMKPSKKVSPTHRMNEEDQGFFASKSRVFWGALAALIALLLWLVYS